MVKATNNKGMKFHQVAIFTTHQTLQAKVFRNTSQAEQKAKSAFEQAQNMQTEIILHMCKVSIRHLLSTGTFYSIQWFCLLTAKILIRLLGGKIWSGPSLSAYVWRHIFVWWGPYSVQQCKTLGPVVQSAVSLTSSLRVISLTILADSIYNILIFFALHCKSYSHFFSKKYQHICASLDVNFNESLTNDIVSFEQLGPDV